MPLIVSGTRCSGGAQAWSLLDDRTLIPADFIPMSSRLIGKGGRVTWPGIGPTRESLTTPFSNQLLWKLEMLPSHGLFSDLLAV